MRTIDDSINLLTNTYEGFLADKGNPDWHKNMHLHIPELYKEMKKLSIVEEENGVVHGAMLGRACAAFVLPFRSALQLADLLKSSILHDWIKRDPTEAIEERGKSNNPFSGNITYANIRTFTRFQLRSAYKIATIILPGQIIDDQEFDNLLRSLETGIRELYLDLLTLPFQMSREEYLALNKNGIKTKTNYMGKLGRNC